MKSNEDIIREACIRANPEIVELKFGCWVELPTAFAHTSHEGKYMITIVKDDYTKDPHVDLVNEKGQIEELVTIDVLEILGRDIRIADILLAIDGKLPSGHWVIAMQQLCFYDINDNELVCLNLLKDRLQDQSEECVVFIAGLLK